MWGCEDLCERGIGFKYEMVVILLRNTMWRFGLQFVTLEFVYIGGAKEGSYSFVVWRGNERRHMPMWLV